MEGKRIPGSKRRTCLLVKCFVHVCAKVSEFSRKCACDLASKVHIYLLDVTTRLATVSFRLHALSRLRDPRIPNAFCAIDFGKLERNTCGIEIRIGTAAVSTNVAALTSPSVKIYFIVIVSGSTLKVSVNLRFDVPWSALLCVFFLASPANCICTS